MNRMLLTVFALIFLMSGLAMAGGDGSPQIFGKINMSYAMHNDGDETGMHLSSNLSRIGVKGWEELDFMGLTAFWKVTSEIDWSAGNDLIGGYETYAGLKNEDYGTLLVGRHRTPFYMLGRKFDMFDETMGDSRNLTHNFGGIMWDNHPANVLMYTLPANLVEGLKVQAMVSEDPADLMSFAGYYKMEDVGGGNICAGASFEMHGDEAAGNLAAESETGIRVGGSYWQDLFKVNVFMQMATYNNGVGAAAELSNMTYGVGGCYKINDEVKAKAQFMMCDPNTDADDDEVMQISAGCDYMFSKRTSIYGMLTMVMNGDANSMGFGNGGGYGDAMAAGTNALGDTAMGIGAGVRHYF